jgi:hypothetical protein
MLVSTVSTQASTPSISSSSVLSGGDVLCGAWAEGARGAAITGAVPKGDTHSLGAGWLESADAGRGGCACPLLAVDGVTTVAVMGSTGAFFGEADTARAATRDRNPSIAPRENCCQLNVRRTQLTSALLSTFVGRGTPNGAGSEAASASRAATLRRVSRIDRDCTGFSFSRRLAASRRAGSEGVEGSFAAEALRPLVLAGLEACSVSSLVLGDGCGFGVTGAMRRIESFGTRSGGGGVGSSSLRLEAGLGDGAAACLFRRPYRRTGAGADEGACGGTAAGVRTGAWYDCRRDDDVVSWLGRDLRGRPRLSGGSSSGAGVPALRVGGGDADDATDGDEL